MSVKTTLDLDRRAAKEASEVLGTKTLKETVNAALKEVVKAERRRRLAERIREGTLPAPTPEELARLRRPTVPEGALGEFFERSA